MLCPRFPLWPSDTLALQQRRCTLSPDELLTIPEPGCRTLYDSLERSARLFPTNKALGWRDQIKVHDVEKEITKQVDGKEVKEKKNWKYFEMTVSRSLSYFGLRLMVHFAQ